MSNQHNRVTIGAKVHPETKKKIISHADRLGISVSGLLDHIVENYLDTTPQEVEQQKKDRDMYERWNAAIHNCSTLDELIDIIGDLEIRFKQGNIPEPVFRKLEADIKVKDEEFGRLNARRK